MASFGGVVRPSSASADSTGQNIANIAKANLGKKACETNSAGGAGYYTSCTGNGGQPEYWCSDFARWVWSQEGIDVSNINPAARSFANDGVQSTPHVGDAVLFSPSGTVADVAHVAIVVQVNADGSVVSVGGDEDGPDNTTEAQYSSASVVAQDGPYPGAAGDPGLNGPILGYVEPPSGNAPTPPAPPTTDKPANSVWVRTYSTATGYSDTNEGAETGSLYAGTNYVFCKAWGAQVGTSSAYNHWWLWTDLDTGGQGYVSAYYLADQGNDQALDTSGKDIATCSGSVGGSGSGNFAKHWVHTFNLADGYASPNQTSRVGALDAGTNYVFCKAWGAQVGTSSAYNHWWLWTDLDTGGQGYVSAYYLASQGNDQALDTSGNDIPVCAGTNGTGAGTDKYYVNTFANATAYTTPGGGTTAGTLNAGSNYVYCKALGSQVGTSSAYNRWWLWTDLDTGGQGYVSAYYLKGEGNDQATDTSGNVIPTCPGANGAGPSGGSAKYYISTFASATGYDSTFKNTVGTLNAGSNYVYCKTWGPMVRNGNDFNHWWLRTDLDTGGQGYVSAYYEKEGGNDQALDTSGNTIPTC